MPTGGGLHRWALPTLHCPLRGPVWSVNEDSIAADKYSSPAATEGPGPGGDVPARPPRPRHTAARAPSPDRPPTADRRPGPAGCFWTRASGPDTSTMEILPGNPDDLSARRLIGDDHDHSPTVPGVSRRCSPRRRPGPRAGPQGRAARPEEADPRDLGADRLTWSVPPDEVVHGHPFPLGGLPQGGWDGRRSRGRHVHVRRQAMHGEVRVRQRQYQGVRRQAAAQVRAQVLGRGIHPGRDGPQRARVRETYRRAK